MKFLKFQFPGLPGIRCLFQMRSDSDLGGNISWKVGDRTSSIRESRQALLADAQSQGMRHWTECNQVHGNDVLINPISTSLEGRPDELPEADGMTTDEKGKGLMIKTADCQPLFLAHKSGRFIMALHVGWRGNRNLFPQEGTRIFCDNYGLKPADLLAVRGPSLGPNNAEFSAFAEEWGEDFRPWFKEGKMNLWNLTKAQLIEAGIAPENIYGLDVCTRANSEEFFSYRANRSTGRQANLIWIVA